MKIIKILFLGIVLVLFNLAYLCAAESPDTIRIQSDLAQPGSTLDLEIYLSIRGESYGGFVFLFQGLPAGVTPAGEDWFTWSADFGQPLVDRSLSPDVTYDFSVDEETGTTALTMTIVGVGIDDQAALGRIPADKSGLIATASFTVPEDTEEGNYEITSPEGGLQILLDPTLDMSPDVPVLEADPVQIFNIPDDNILQLDAALTALSGGTLSVPVSIANKDIVGSGSFAVDYPPSALTLSSVVAGARAGGMSFDFSIADATALAAVGDKRATVTFTGGEIPVGGLGELCTLGFTVASVGAGAEASVVLASAAMKDAADADLTVAASPQGTAEVTFTFADTLAVDVEPGTAEKGVPWEGSGVATIIDGQLHLPIRLKNSVPVEVVRFYITEGPAEQTGLLSLAAEQVMKLTPTTDWVITVEDFDTYLQVAAYAATSAAAIPAGDDVIFHLLYNINLTAEEIPGVDDAGIDVDFTLAGVEVVDDSDNFVGIEKLGATATVDWRVPNSGEGVGPGASLPKAFALTQNHPNPFNPSTTINYQIPEDASNVSFTLNVYDIRGRVVKTLASGMKGAGFYSAFWDGTDSNGREVSSGVYFYRFVSSKYSATRKMILLK